MRPAFRSTAVPALAAALLAGHAAAQVPAPASSLDRGWTVPAGPLAPAPIPREEIAARRQALVQQMGDGVFIYMGAEEPSASWSAFAQESRFRYLTGYDEPGAMLVISKRGGQVSERLYVMPRDPASEIWNGARIGAEGAARMTGIPAYDQARMAPALDSLLAGAATLYTLTPERGRGVQSPEQQFIQNLRSQHAGIRQVTDVSDRLRTLRGRKSAAELDMLRRAIHITSLAQREAMRAAEPGMNEFEVHALIEGTFRRYGSERPAFGSIVASGPNSTTLHYRTADRYMQAGETLVMDIGASYNGYSADVTRTIPVGGRFTPEQRAVYEIVLAAQKAAEAQARPGVTMSRLNQAASAVMAQGLVRLGLMDSDTATFDCERGGAVRPCPQLSLYYMHAIGHGIGLDVHDPEIGYTAGFAVGSAFTLEPGIYVRADVLDYLPDTPRNRAFRQRVRGALERYRNIGVRIEDDYLVTEQGLERPSEGAPREIDEIEALMGQESLWNRERRPEMVEWYRGVHPR